MTSKSELALAVKWVLDHSEDCAAIEAVADGRWKTVWGPVRRGVYRDRLGRNNGGTCHWLRVECNDPSCPAEVLVRESDILEAIPNG